MSESPIQRSLAERAVAALGGAGVLGRALGAPQPVPSPQPMPGTDAAPGAATAPDGETLRAAPARPESPGEPGPRITRRLLLTAGANSLEGSRSRCSEELAIVQQQVIRTVRATVPGGGRNARLVMVTSARPDEGKSFTSLNLAAAIARSGASPALLVDADGKPGDLSSLLSCDKCEGLRELAVDPRLAVLPLVLPTEAERLSFLPYGRGGGSLPTGNALGLALQRVADAHPRHVIVIDTPPALSTSEASALAPIVGQVLLVVRAAVTQRSEVEAALDMLDACPTLQLVLNQARISSSDSFGAYGYEAYGTYARR